MPYILTQIAQAATNTERVNLFLNGKFWLGLRKNDLLSLKLFKNKEISNEEKLTVEKTALDGKILDKAINYLQLRPRSCAEVKDYLVYRKKIPLEEAENVINYLLDNELLSDEKFAKWYVDNKLSNGVNGINKIKMELLQKKVSAKIISNVLEITFANEDFKDEQMEKLKEYTDKVIKTIKAKDNYELKSKLVQRLMARGFKYEDIKKVLAWRTLNLVT